DADARIPFARPREESGHEFAACRLDDCRSVAACKGGRIKHKLRRDKPRLIRDGDRCETAHAYEHKTRQGLHHFNFPVREFKPIEVLLAESSAPAQSTIMRRRQKCQISASTRHANREARRSPSRQSRRMRC